MSWPHPVVCIAAKLAKRFRRCSYQPNIGIFFVDQQEELVAVEVVLYISYILTFLRFLFFYLLAYRFKFLVVFFAGSVTYCGFHLVGNIFHTLQEKGSNTLCRQFFLHIVCPEAIVEQVAVYCAEVGYGIISTVVVGEQQSVSRDHLGSAAAAKLYHRVLQAGVVYIIQVLFCKAQSQALHLIVIFTNEHRNPHALIGPRTQRHYYGNKK